MGIKDILRELFAALYLGIDGAHSKAVQKVMEAERSQFNAQFDAMKQECERLQEALRESEAQRQKDAQRISDLQSQLRQTQAELERVKTGKQSPVMTDDDFLKACGLCNVSQVEEAIINGANVNAKDKSGFTALIWAAKEGHIKIVELLLKHNADVNIKDKYGRTALFWASARGYTETTELLLKHRADVNAKNKQGETALTWAIKKGHTETVNLLRSYGAK